MLKESVKLHNCKILQQIKIPMYSRQIFPIRENLLRAAKHKNLFFPSNNNPCKQFSNTTWNC